MPISRNTGTKHDAVIAVDDLRSIGTKHDAVIAVDDLWSIGMKRDAVIAVDDRSLPHFSRSADLT